MQLGVTHACQTADYAACFRSMSQVSSRAIPTQFNPNIVRACGHPKLLALMEFLLKHFVGRVLKSSEIVIASAVTSALQSPRYLQR